jgi:hypothetical protein
MSTVFLMIWKRGRDRCVPKRPQKLSPIRFFIIIIILEHFGEDANGRNGHGHVSKSIEAL